MNNEEKYKTPQERDTAFRRFCDERLCNPECPCNTIDANCRFIWLTLEAEEKPLPCPFCGAEAEVVEASRLVMPRGTFVQCKNCWAFVAGFKTKTEAIAAWNRRVK